MNKEEEFIIFWVLAVALACFGYILVIRYLNKRDIRKARKPGPAPRI